MGILVASAAMTGASDANPMETISAHNVVARAIVLFAMSPFIPQLVIAV
jgi:hypothetical protein